MLYVSVLVNDEYPVGFGQRLREKLSILTVERWRIRTVTVSVALRLGHPNTPPDRDRSP